MTPPKDRHQARYYDEQQTAAMFEALEHEPLKYKAMIYVALTGDLRRSELMGLHWSDIDLVNNTITVGRVSQYIPKIGIITKEPKNKTSERVVAMPKSVMDILRALRVSQAENRLICGELWQGSEELFITEDGRRMHPDTITGWWGKFIKRHGLPAMNFHGLRHTSATLLISDGISISNVSSRLGHANTSTTMNIYAHALKSKDREAADRFENLKEKVAKRASHKPELTVTKSVTK